MFERDETVEEVLACFGQSWFEGRVALAHETLHGDFIWTPKGQKKIDALRARVDREALRTIRRLGGDWRAVFEFLVAVEQEGEG